MLSLVLLLQLPGPAILTILKWLHWIKLQERIEYKVISTTYKLLQSSSPHYMRDLITVQPSRSTQSSALVTLFQPSVDSSLKITNRSYQYAVAYLNCETRFLLLFVFLISSIRHHLPALLHRRTLILDCLLTFLVAFSIFFLKLSFS